MPHKTHRADRHVLATTVLMLAASAFGEGPSPSASTIPCAFNSPFLGWTGVSPTCQPGARVACKTSADCAALAGACCPHYGPGTGTCAFLHCLKADQNDTTASAFCGMNTSSPPGGSGINATPAGTCRLASRYPVCARCNAGPCGPGSVRHVLQI